MWRLFLFLLILIFSVWFGLEIVHHPGYLLLVYEPWTVEMPVWFALLTFLIFLGLFYLLITSIDHIRFLFYRFKNWLYFRREQKSYSKTQLGLTALIEGRWKRAEQLLIAGVNQTLDPLINYLAAAKAAHEQGAYDKRDVYIQKAYKIAPHAELAIGLTQAQLEFDQGQFEHAEATLNHLFETSPYHPGVLKLLEKIVVRLGDFDRLMKLIPNMRKAKVLDKEQAALFEKNLYAEMLNQTRIKSLEDLQKIWQEMPRSLRKDPNIIYLYTKQLLRFHAALKTIDPKRAIDVQKEAEDLIRKTLNHSWHEGLVNLYGTIQFKNVDRQLVIAGAWLKMYGERKALLLLLGKLCVEEKLWGKAKDYFEKCVAQGQNAACIFEYGKLLEQLGEMNAATQLYRNELMQIAEAPS
jgi:HemY protein